MGDPGELTRQPRVPVRRQAPAGALWRSVDRTELSSVDPALTSGTNAD
jgi:hypothetical protein